MRPVDFAGIIVALIAASAAWLSSRSASKAATTGVTIGGRLDAEKEAYERARAMDVETIERQERELGRLRKSSEECESVIRRQQVEIDTLKRQLRALARRSGQEGLLDGPRSRSDEDEPDP